MGPTRDTATISAAVKEFSLLTEYDVYLLKQGEHFHLFDKLGSHTVEVGGEAGVCFGVWAPNAREVSVIGKFNDWQKGQHRLHRRPDDSGIWEGFIAGITRGTAYKYHVVSSQRGYAADKTDPFAVRCEVPPRTASIVWDAKYKWSDANWLRNRQKANALTAPISIYELHLGSWRRVPDENNRPLTYRELADVLPAYLRDMGFTHVEFMPVTEHPFYGSWGYQTTGYFAATARYGSPQDLMHLIDQLHQHGIGVILDWVPSHFPSDEHGLAYFDGTHLFEHADPRQGFHPDWNSYIFNYGRSEVRAFLISSAIYWLEKFHVDALRVDAVASMLYLDYARREGEWVPNEHGGRENLQAIHFLRRLNEAVYSDYPDTQVIAEESTSWPMVSRPTSIGGLGFGFKWNMGWMHDTLSYMSLDAIHRKYHHNQLTFSIWYAFFENFVLPLSHDEVVHGKGSLIGKMSGDHWQKFANLRTLFGYMYAHPGKKLLFMGAELAQWREWNHDASLDWHLLDQPEHRGIQHWLRDLNHLYASEPALSQRDMLADGFEWVDCNDWEQSIISFVRKGDSPLDVILVACNFTPIPRSGYRLGVPHAGHWRELLNSDASIYGGSNVGNYGGLDSEPVAAHGREQSIVLTLPPLSIVLLKPENRKAHD